MSLREPLSHRRVPGVRLMIATAVLGGIAAVAGVVATLVSANGNIAPPTLPGLASPAALSGQSTEPVLPAGLPTGLPSLPGTLPSDLPSLPTGLPTALPTGLPTALPTGLPTALPTGLPTALPTGLPSLPGGGAG
jgi:hypothetical protein